MYILRLDTATSLSFLLVAGRQSISIPFHPERICLSASPFFTATHVKSTLISRYSTTLLVYSVSLALASGQKAMALWLGFGFFWLWLDVALAWPGI
jgi:hypothetical protein